MIKIFNSVGALLNATDGFQTNSEGNITLTQEQMKTIDERLKAYEEEKKTNEKAVNEAQQALDDAKKDLEAAKEAAKEKDAQIANLKASAGDKTNDNPVNTKEVFSAQDVFNLVKDI